MMTLLEELQEEFEETYSVCEGKDVLIFEPKYASDISLSSSEIIKKFSDQEYSAEVFPISKKGKMKGRSAEPYEDVAIVADKFLVYFM